MAVPARAEDDKLGTPPPLDAPVLDAPLLAPGDPAPAPAPMPTPVAPNPAPTAPSSAPVGAAPHRSSAVLALPGMIRPATAARLAPAPAPAPGLAAPLVAPEPAAPAGRLALEPPLAEYRREDLPAALPGDAAPGRVIVSRPAGAEPGDEPGLDVPSLGDREATGPAADPSPLRTTPSRSGTKATTRIEPTPRDAHDPGRSSSTPAPPRRRLFGLLPPPPSSVRSSSARRPVPDREPASKPAAAERDEPEVAAQEALRRRIEKQARLYAGDRAASVEVRLDQKHATVRATGVRFYQKRAVRRSLESLPALAGLSSTIEVLD